MVKLDQPILVLVLLLAARGPVEGWYKQAAGPNYYSVGRAAGLLSGIRRSPLRRAELDPPEDHLDTQLLHNQVLENTNVCVKNLNLRSCEPIPDDRTVFRCEATVLLMLDSRECANT